MAFTLCWSWGVASFAVSAIDIALWDLKGKRENLPLWKMAGGKDNTCKAYCGGIDLAFPLPKLLNSIQGYLDSGFNAVKIKIGQKDLNADIARIKAVRELIGPDITFMIDANYSLSVKDAIWLSKQVEQYDITWFEEPTLPDNYKGFAEIADNTSIPLAMGKIYIPFMNSDTLLNKQNLDIANQMLQIAVVSRVGCKQQTF